MGAPYSEEYLRGLVRELCALPREEEWVELKRNNDKPEEIGEYISALSNSAALVGKPHAYLVWGIDDKTRSVVGTHVDPARAKVKGQELENWLLQLLTPKINFRFLQIEVDGRPVVLLEIDRAHTQPVRFQGEEYIRIGSYKKKLKEHPAKERELWRLFDRTTFEEGIAAEHVTTDQVLKLLDYQSYFDLLKLPLPEGKNGICGALKEDALIQMCPAGGWNITNLGAILFAKNLESFPSLSRKAMRIIVYKGKGRIATEREQVWRQGYASGFEGLITFINGLIPKNEHIEKAFRKTVPMYPDLAIRELVPNALIHQDFFLTGTGPMVELFEDRMEITNPGRPVVSIERFVNTPPRSRNEALASLMRRMNICEERGSGIDKVVFQTELCQLPAPLFEAPDESTRSVLFAYRTLKEMDRDDRIRACYLHACLKYVSREYLTNTSLRERFGIEQRNSATASRFIKEAVAAGLIHPVDENAPRKLMKYAPYWVVGPDAPDGRE